MKIFGEELVIKMWDSFIDKGIGGILKPAHEKRLGKARSEIRRDELLLLAQTEIDAKKIASGEAIYCGNGNIKLLSNDSDIDENGRLEPSIGDLSIASLAVAASTSESILKEVNVAKAVIYAERELLSSEANTSDKELEKDWLFAWRDHAAKVSTEELQLLWGKVLAGEVKNPGSYSMRTMEFLKCLSKAEAKLIEQAAQYVIYNVVFKDLTQHYELKGLNFAKLLELQSLGMISGVGSTGMSYTLPIVRNDPFLGIIKTDSHIIKVENLAAGIKIAMQVYVVTPLGQEVFKLCNSAVEEECVYKIAQLYANKAEKVELDSYTLLDNGNLHITNSVKVPSSDI